MDIQQIAFRTHNPLGPYAAGDTEVWYMRDEFFHDGIMGFSRVKAQGRIPDPQALNKSHILLGTIQESDPNGIYHLMQGEQWSPNGEARELIREKKLKHTSMCVGDIIVIHGRTFFVDNSGFKELT